MAFEKDLKALEKELLETEQRIKKLEEHRESAKKDIQEGRLDKNLIEETLRRLDRNLNNLNEKRELLIKEIKS